MQTIITQELRLKSFAKRKRLPRMTVRLWYVALNCAFWLRNLQRLRMSSSAIGFDEWKKENGEKRKNHTGKPYGLSEAWPAQNVKRWNAANATFSRSKQIYLVDARNKNETPKHYAAVTILLDNSFIDENIVTRAVRHRVEFCFVFRVTFVTYLVCATRYATLY